MPMNQAAPSHSEAANASGLGRSAKGLQELVDEAQVEFGVGVGLDDARLDAIAYSRHPQDVDDVRRKSILERTTDPAVADWLRGLGTWEAGVPVRVPSNPKLGMLGRLCVPVRWQGRLLAFLWLLDSPGWGDTRQVRATAAYAARIAAVLAHEEFLAERDRVLEAECVRRLVRGEGIAGGLPRQLAGAEEIFVAVVLARSSGAERSGEAAQDDLREAFEDLRGRLAPRPVIGSVEGGEDIFVLARGAGGEAQLQRQFEAWCRSGGAGHVRIGVSDSHALGSDLSAAHAEARWSAEAAGAAGSSGCVFWKSLGASRVLLKLLDGRPAGRLLPDGLVRLREADGGPTLLSTLATYLEAGCDSKATAAAFSIHRNTLYQRLRRIEELSGMDLKKGDDRLDLHLGVRLLRFDAGLGGLR